MHLTRTCRRLTAPSPASRGAFAITCLLTLRGLPTSVLGHLPPCPIHQAFGVLCPGCGGTRALLAVLHGDLRGAWQLNPLLLALAPFFLLYAASTLHRGVAPRLPTSALSILLVLTLAFTIARNL